MGYPGFEASGLAGLLAPAGTPMEAIEPLHAETIQLLKRPDIVDRFVALGLDAVGIGASRGSHPHNASSPASARMSPTSSSFIKRS